MAVELAEIYKNPIIFLCEARACGSDEKIDDYMAAMEQERKGISSLYVEIIWFNQWKRVVVRYPVFIFVWWVHPNRCKSCAKVEKNDKKF